MKNYLWNMFATIKNGQLAKRKFVYHRHLNVCQKFLLVLWEEGFISGYKIDFCGRERLKIFLKYYKNGRPTIKSLKSLSKPGNRFSLSLKQIWKIDSSKVFVVFSTNQGLKSISECKKLGIGGIPFIVIE